jgi:hypothetical protein
MDGQIGTIMTCDFDLFSLHPDRPTDSPTSARIAKITRDGTVYLPVDLIGRTAIERAAAYATPDQRVFWLGTADGKIGHISYEWLKEALPEYASAWVNLDRAVDIARKLVRPRWSDDADWEEPHARP